MLPQLCHDPGPLDWLGLKIIYASSGRLATMPPNRILDFLGQWVVSRGISNQLLRASVAKTTSLSGV